MADNKYDGLFYHHSNSLDGIQLREELRMAAKFNSKHKH